MITTANGVKLDRIELFTAQHGHVSYGTQPCFVINANGYGVMAS
jgi:hypothetical protein